jgi:hypothetical protein
VSEIYGEEGTSQSPTYSHQPKILSWTIYIALSWTVFAIDHKTMKTGLPVRSAVLNHCAGRPVVGWVTTSESLLLIVFAFFVLLISMHVYLGRYMYFLVSAKYLVWSGLH